MTLARCTEFRMALAFLILVSSYLLPSITNVQAHIGTPLSAWTSNTPKVNGNIDCFGSSSWLLVPCPLGGNEWSDAATLAFGTTPSGTVYMKNDYQNLYIAVKIVGDEENLLPPDAVVVDFDNNHNGGASETGDDRLVMRGDMVLQDLFLSSSGFFLHDILNSGNRDGAGAAQYVASSSTWFFEMVHPLNTGDDSHDFSLVLGQTVGFGVTYQDGSGGGFGFCCRDYVVAYPPSTPTSSTRDLTIRGIEVTQAVQCFDDLSTPSLPTSCVTLAKGKTTIVRVYVDSGPAGAPDTDSEVYLYGAQLTSTAGVETATSLGFILSYVTAKSSGGSAATITDTANFALPSSWLSNDRLVLQAFIKGTTTTTTPMHETNYDNNWMRVAASIVTERTYQFQGTFIGPVQTVNIDCAAGATTNLPGAAAITAQKDYLRKVLPFPDVTFSSPTTMEWAYTYNSANAASLNALLETTALAMIPIPAQIYGFLSSTCPTGGGLLGKSLPKWLSPSNAGISASGIATSPGTIHTMAHEISHDLQKSLGDGEIVVYSTDGLYGAVDTLIDGNPSLAIPIGTPLVDDPKIKFVDANGNGVRNAGETVVYSSDGDAIYDSGEPVIFSSAGPPTPTTSLLDDPSIKYIDSTMSDGVWNPGTWGRHVSGPRIIDPAGTAAYGCGAGGVDPWWPSNKGNIGGATINGLDTWTMTFYASTTQDYMTYCLTPWISAYRWNNILQTYATSSTGPLSLDSLATLQASPPTQDSMLISGTILATGPGSIDTVFHTATELAATSGIPTSFPFILEMRNSTGGTIAFDYIDPVFVDSDGNQQNTYYFNQVLPYSPAATEIRLIKMTPAGTQVLASKAATAHAPTVRVLSPNGGESWSGTQTVSWTASDPDTNQPLSYLVQYSADGGSSWLPLAFPLQGNMTSVSVDTSTLKGSNNALVRVLASDGFYTTIDVSNAVFTVPNKPPTAYPDPTPIWLPITTDDTVLLQGEGVDLEDGTIPANMTRWSSSIDGTLGTGKTLSVHLSPGKHNITLTVTDSGGLSNSETGMITVRVPSDNQLFELDWADYDNNGRIDILDVANAAFYFDRQSSYWDLNLNGKVDITEIALVAFHFDQQLAGDPYPGKGNPSGTMDAFWRNYSCLLRQPYSTYAGCPTG